MDRVRLRYQNRLSDLDRTNSKSTRLYKEIRMGLPFLMMVRTKHKFAVMILKGINQIWLYYNEGEQASSIFGI